MTAQDSQPFISVIMPIRNESAFIRESLGAVLGQDYPADKMEVLVVDGMSTDDTRDIVAELARTHLNLRLLDNPKHIVPTAMNIALRAVRGEVVVRVDGHCVIAPDYCSRCVAHLLEERVDGVGGPIQTIGSTYLARGIAVAMSSPFGVGGVAFRTIEDRKMLVDTVAFPAYTREVILKAGLYDEELRCNEDDEFNHRLRKLDSKILLAPDVRSKYYSRSSLKKLWWQYCRYGYWKVRVMQKHPRQMRPRHFVPPLFVIALVTSVLLAPWTIWPLAAIGGGYLIANLIASVTTAARAGWENLPVLPLAYATLHLGYGFGFCWGLVRFAGRWNDLKGQIPDFNAPNDGTAPS